jgi:hypothetical protein
MSPKSQKAEIPLAPELARQVDQICERFELALLGGRHPRIDDYLDEAPELARTALLAELLSIEVEYRHRNKDSPQVEEYLMRFPDHEKLVRSVVEATIPWKVSNQRVDDSLGAPCTMGPSTLPSSLNGFQWVRRLGRGGHGEVWLAIDTNLQQERAIKLLRRDRYSPQGFTMLIREARVMARLARHRNRVQVHSLIPEKLDCFLVMDYVDGGPLSAQISPETSMPWGKAARYLADIADGLSEVHAAGILHRDIKPSNILWDSKRDEVALCDFGIAAHADEAAGVAGTPGYIAPELDGGMASEKSEVFSLAATFFCMLAGQPPFADRTLVGSIAKARAGLAPPIPALSCVPKSIEEVILAGLTPNPDQRPQLSEFIARLRGAHLQELASKLLAMAHQAAGRVKLNVSVWTASEPELVFRPAPSSGDVAELQDGPDQASAMIVQVHTGDLVRIQATANADGYLTVLNLGSSGRLGVLFPNPLACDNRVLAGQPHRLTFKLSPPSGTDRAAVIWTRQRDILTPREWAGRIAGGDVAGSPPEISTRDLDLVLYEAGQQPAETWTTTMITISHGAPP